MAKQIPKVIRSTKALQQPIGDQVFQIKRYKDDPNPMTINFEAGYVDHWGKSDLTVKIFNQETIIGRSHESLAITTKNCEKQIKLKLGTKACYKIPFGENHTEKIKSSLGKLAIYIARVADQCDNEEIKLSVCPLPTEILDFKICPINTDHVFRLPNKNDCRNFYEEENKKISETFPRKTMEENAGRKERWIENQKARNAWAPKYESDRYSKSVVTRKINEHGCYADPQVAEILETQHYSNANLNGMVKNLSTMNKSP